MPKIIKLGCIQIKRLCHPFFEIENSVIIFELTFATSLDKEKSNLPTVGISPE